MNEKTGRTFWDWVSENPKLFIFLLIVSLVAAWYVINNFRVQAPGWLIERQDEGKTGQTENDKEKPENKSLKNEATRISESNLSKPKVPSTSHNNEVFPSHFSGIILNQKEIPISGAVVKCSNCIATETVTSNSNGEYFLKYSIDNSKRNAELKITVGNKSINIYPSLTQTQLDNTIFEQ